MKRRSLYSSALIPALLASGGLSLTAAAQVVNFHDAGNGAISLPGVGYNELFVGQGAYPDPGNDIWNGFSQSPNYGSTYFYSGPPGNNPPWQQQSGNPGNPYAQYGGYASTISSTGSSLFNFSGSPSTCGNADSTGNFTPVTFSTSPYDFDNSYGYPYPDGSPQFLLLCAAVVNPNAGSDNPPTTLTFTLGNLPYPSTNVYGLYVYDANDSNDRGAGIALEAANLGNAHSGISSTTNRDDPDGRPDPLGYGEGANFVIFENVVADSSGNIVVTLSPTVTNPYSGNNGEIDLTGAQLIINPKPTEVGLNSASNVYLGQNASFSFSPVFADEASTNPSYLWQFSANNGASWGSVGANSTGVTSSNLTVTSVAATNAGLYHCVITDNLTHAVGTTPPVSLSILTSTATNVLSVGDGLTDVNNGNISLPGNTIPPSVHMTVTNVEDGTLFQYQNFGANGNSTTTGFTGPAGFIVTPQAGPTIVTGIRFYASSSHPEDDPANYTLQGSTNGPSGPWTTLATGSLSLPVARNSGGGPINVSNEVLQEVDFTNTHYAYAYQLTFNDVRNDATATNGVQLGEVQLLGSVQGPPDINQNLPTTTVDAPACVPFTLSVGVVGTGPFTYTWVRDGSTTVQTGSSSSYTFSTLSGTHTYAVTVSGTYPPSVTSSNATIVSGPSVVTLNNGTNWTINQNGASFSGAPFISGNELETTDGNGGGEAASAFYNTPQYIAGFIAEFDYVPGWNSPFGPPPASYSPADGTTFCLQNSASGSNALGGAGGALGYNGLTSAAAFELNIFENVGVGAAVSTNGSTGPYFSTSPVNLLSGNPIYVQLYYQQSVLQVFLEDTGTQQVFSTNIPVNLPAAVGGGSSAYIGFTGADGGNQSIEEVTNFQYSATTAPVISSIAKGSSPGTVVVSWPASVSPLFTLYQSSTVNGAWTPANESSLTQNGCLSQVTLTAGAQTQFYQLALYPPQ